jgi:hypothetical protein
MRSKRMVITVVTIVVSLLLAVSAGAQPGPAVPDGSPPPGIPRAEESESGGTTVYLPLVLSNYVPVAARYREAWKAIGGAAGALGNATAADVEGIHSEERFEHGMMYWRDNATEPDYVYALYYTDDEDQQTGTWARYDDEWEEGMPVYSCSEAEDNRPLGPKLGFGLVWCTHASVRTGLGVAIEAEVYTDGGYQDFTGGTMLWSARGDVIYVLFDDGTWRRYPDVGGRFFSMWLALGGATSDLGFPTDLAVDAAHSGQKFEMGWMYWRDNPAAPNYIYALEYESDEEQHTGTWSGYDDGWEEGMPVYSCSEAEDNRPLGPKLGFGLVWCTHTSVRTGLGAAIEEEQYYNGAYQDFEGGTMLWSARDGAITVLLDDDTWRSYFEVGERFAQVWEELGGPDSDLGWAIANDVTAAHSGQKFETGWMYWRDNASEPDYVYALEYESSEEQHTGTWSGYDDEWEEGMPVYSCSEAEDNRPLGPKLGFGLVWCTHASVRTGLGEALEEEHYYDGAYQDFEGGAMLWSARDDAITVLLDDGTWQQ